VHVAQIVDIDDDCVDDVINFVDVDDDRIAEAMSHALGRGGRKKKVQPTPTTP